MSSTELQIRPERADQPQVRAMLDALDAYLANLYAPEDNHILDVQALLAPEVCFLVARGEGGVLLGCGAFRRMPAEADTDDRPYVEIKRMYVEPAARGRRIAEHLLAELERIAASEGTALALLETGRDQHEAVRLYERLGYRRRGPFAGYPDNGLSVFYAKRLLP